MSAQASDPRDPRLDPAIVAAVKDTVHAHPFWSYEQVAEELRRAGHKISAIGVAWVRDAR